MTWMLAGCVVFGLCQLDDHGIEFVLVVVFSLPLLAPLLKK